ncbi:MAG: hypothetical protein FJW68_08365 [Actinobacteria bacterium]|nr:hypothetical protein [Actinomycetota bacterium]
MSNKKIYILLAAITAIAIFSVASLCGPCTLLPDLATETPQETETTAKSEQSSPPKETAEEKEAETTAETAKEEMPAKDSGSLFPEGLVLPQVFFIAKAFYSEADINGLQSNVIEPVIEYFESLGQTVVSIEIDSDNRGGTEKNYFLFTVIVSKNDGTPDPIHMGFMHYKVDGNIPLWEMEMMD